MEDERDAAAALGAAVDEARCEDGLNQADLAALLNVGQPHLSRVLAGKARPSVKLAKRMDEYLSNRSPAAGKSLPDWVGQVVDAANASEDFRQLLVSALALYRNK